MGYFDNCVNKIAEEAELDMDEAKAIVMAMVDTFIEEGDLPKMPSEGEDMTAWEEAAKKLELEDASMALIYELTEGGDEDDDEGDDDEDDDDEASEE